MNSPYDSWETRDITVDFVSSEPTITGGTSGSQTYCHGDAVSFSVSASGEDKSYLWERSTNSGSSWSNISGATSSTYSFTASSSQDGYMYRCRVYNACGDATNQREITLNVETAPSITSHPSHDEVCPGDNASFTVSASGTSPAYQWYKNGNPISGANSSTLTLNNIKASDAGNYYCKATNDCGNDQSNSATLTVNTPATLTADPGDLTVCDGEPATFSVTVTGTSPISYQWQKSGDGGASWSNLAGKTSSTLNYATDMNDDGDLFRCKVSNECESGINSNDATLTVLPLPSVSLGEDVHVCTGESTVLDPGAGYNSYSWDTGPTTQTIQVSEAGTYTVTVTDANGCENSDDIQVFLDPNIDPIDLGEDVDICLGESVKLDPGAGYDQYDWSTDAVSQSINVTETGTYTVTVRNDNSVCEQSAEVFVNVHHPYEEQELGVVTVDVNSGDNLVIWENTPQAGITHYKIYRGPDGKELEIGEVPIGNATQFQDVGTFDGGQSYRYKITIIDTCGNESDYSTSHKTMHLTASTGTAGEVNLSWNHYEGFDVDWYYIFRGKSPTSFDVYDSVQYDPTTTEKTDYNPLPPPDTSFYRIGVKAPKTFYTNVKKVGSGPYSYSLSNVEDNRASMTDIKWIHSEGLKIYPNPMQHHATIRFANPGSQAHTLYLRDMSGRTVRVVDEVRSGEYILYKKDLAAGLYYIEIRGAKVFRGKVVIE